jgi:GR25 family glycosyltransferase involved in LPS biosynthesis
MVAEVIFAPPKRYCIHFDTEDLWGTRLIHNQAHVSLTSAYYSIFASCIYHNYENVLIVEDDIHFENDFESNLFRFMKHLPNDWGYLNLGYCKTKLIPNGWKVYDVNDYVSEIDVSWTTHITAYRNKDICQKLINRMNNINDSIEFVLNYYTHIDKSFKGYTPKDILCTQLSYRDENSIHQVFKSLIYN